MHPLTTAGKFLTGVIGLPGIGIIALPAGILSSGLIEELQKKKKDRKRNS
jgi:voltage-gated potassium channel